MLIFTKNNVSTVQANYFLMNEVKSSLKGFDPNAFSFLYLNIVSTKKNFKNFKELLKNLSVGFNAICLSEIWCEAQDESKNSNFILSGYNFFISIGNIAEEEVFVFLWKHPRQYLSINCDAIESSCLEITNEKSKNVIRNLTYRPPNSDVKEFGKH